MQRKWKRHWQRLAKTIVPPIAAGMLLVSAYSPGFANPADGTVTSGAAIITANGSTMTVNQTTNNAVINWQSFTIGKGETVNFIQPTSASVALNRVVGNDASSIFGSLNANGRVYLINPNGILFAPGSQVNVGGLVASTLNISDNDFLNNNTVFGKNGSAQAVVNQGYIAAADYVALLGPAVKNEGTIAARVTGLAAGNKVSLDFNGDKLLNVTVDTGAAGGSAGNTGTINASGGLVVMSAGTKDKLLDTVVNNSGIIRAHSVNNVNGVIRLEGGSVTNSGAIDASGKAAGQTGGTVKVLGDTVTLTSGSTIDVSGDTGGGIALVGGAYQGGSSEYTATNTTVQNGAAINADAITSGNGGKVVVWANDTTKFAGTITARGGSVSGDGGSVETSGKKTLTVSGTVLAGAKNGSGGTWLLDPTDYTIEATAAASLMTSLNSGTNVEAKSSDGTSGLNGDLNLAAPITWTGNSILTLTADNKIYVNANISASGSGAGLALTTATGNYSLGKNVKITLSGNGATFSMNGATYTVINNYSIGGTHSTNGALQALQNVGADATSLNGQYFIGVDIDASGTSSWNSGAGFAPIGTDPNASGTAFSGIFDGGGHTISGLYIKRDSTDYVGLFGYNKGTLRNVGLTGGNITGHGYVGALAGENDGSYGGNASITNCYNTGSVSSGMLGDGDNAGGLVGFNYGLSGSATITDCYNTGTVTNYDSTVGGLVGNNNHGSITNCYNTGHVYASIFAGGLVGYNGQGGSIANSYSTGGVNRDGAYAGYVGGLVGVNGSRIENSYSTGVVYGTGTSNHVQSTGGLVGLNGVDGDIVNCYSTGAVHVQQAPYSGPVGGLVGTNESNGKITNCYWDIDTSLQASGIGSGTTTGPTAGVIGLNSSTGSTAFSAGSYSGWSIATDGGSSSVWRIYGGYSYPLLRSFLTPLTVSMNAAKTYDGTTVNGNSSWLSYSLAGIDTSLINYDNLGYTSGGSGIRNAKTYSNVQVTGLYSGQQGYDISYTPGMLVINRRDITVSAVANTKTYDGTSASSLTPTASWLATGDTLSVVQEYNNKNAGSGKTLSVTSCAINDSNGGNNYNVTPVNANGVINKATLTVGDLTANNKVYDGTTAAAVTGTLIGVCGSDTVALTSGTFSDKNAGTGKTVTVNDSSVSGIDAGNYILNATATADITRATLTVSATGVNKFYDGTAAATAAYSDNRIAGDVLTISGTAAFGDKNAGNGKTLNVINITLGGTDAGNYTVNTTAATTADIAKATLAVTADNVTKYVGQANPTFTATYHGLMGGDTPASLTGTLDFGTGATTSSSLGKYAITPYGQSSSNYDITYVNGVLTIRQQTEAAYDSAVIYADQIGFGFPGRSGRPDMASGYWGHRNGYLNGAIGGSFVPLTIVGGGINTDTLPKI